MLLRIRAEIKSCSCRPLASVPGRMEEAHQARARGRQAHSTPGNFEGRAGESMEKPSKWRADVRKAPRR